MAPFSAMTSAIARPSPLAAPVTTVTRPRTSKSASAFIEIGPLIPAQGLALPETVALEPLVVEPRHHEARDRADRKRDQEHQEHLLDREMHVEQEAREERPGDRPEATDAERPARAVGSDRGRVEHGRGGID